MNSTYSCLTIGGALGGEEGLAEEKRSGEGMWVGWMGDGVFVSGVLATQQY